MRYRIPLLLGIGVGLAVGARVGRPGYEKLSRRVRELRERPELQEAAGLVSAQAEHLVGRARGAVAQRVGHYAPASMHQVLSGPNGSSAR